MVPEIHRCIVGMHDVKFQDEFICDTGGEHPDAYGEGVHLNHPAATSVLAVVMEAPVAMVMSMVCHQSSPRWLGHFRPFWL
jgi:hypothetical protein